VLVTLDALLVANFVALVLAAIWLATLVLPYDRAVRVRNAFLLRRGRDEDLVWAPDRVPPDFRVERNAVPPEIARAVDAAAVRALAGDWRRALALVTLLVQHAKDEGHARADLATTFREIVAGRGSCADYVRVYLAAAHHVGLFCRQWGFTFNGYGGHGHVFVEVYDRDRRRWAFLDVHNNVYATAEGSNEPLDALGVRDRLRRGDSIVFRRAGAGRLGWSDADKLLAYYRRGAEEWYMLWGNDVVTRDDARGRWAHRLRSALAMLPPYVAIATPAVEPAIARMVALRQRVTIAASLAGALSLLLCVQTVARLARHG
jgi:hypothetical protein